MYCRTTVVRQKRLPGSPCVFVGSTHSAFNVDLGIDILSLALHPRPQDFSPHESSATCLGFDVLGDLVDDLGTLRLEIAKELRDLGTRLPRGGEQGAELIECNDGGQGGGDQQVVRENVGFRGRHGLRDGRANGMSEQVK